jgi:hypothetical protein
MDWETLNATDMWTAKDLARMGREFQAMIAAGKSADEAAEKIGIECVWPLLCGDPAKDLAAAGIDPNAPPSLPEPLH